MSHEKQTPKECAEIVVSQMIDELPYTVKYFFGGWPEDVIGKRDTDTFYRELYAKLDKYIEAERTRMEEK